MIDVSKEKLFPLREAAEYLPRRNRKKVHFSTLFRWATYGCRGKQLDTCLVGGIRFTSAEAIARFLNGAPVASTTSTARPNKPSKPSDAVLAAEAKLNQVLDRSKRPIPISKITPISTSTRRTS